LSENKSKFLVVGLGEILWDILPDGKQLGGAPTNFAYHSQVLGSNAVIVSCIGSDELGKEILDTLKNLELPADHIAIDSQHPTGTVTVALDARGKPDYEIHENVAWDFIPARANLIALASKADAVCFGTLSQRSKASRKTIRKFLEATRPDCIRIYDINLRRNYYTEQIVDDSLKHAQVLKLNDEELPAVAQMLDITGDEDTLLQTILKRYELKLIVLTKGSEGSVLFADGEKSVSKSSDKIEIADTVGAGDAFTAAVTTGLLHGKSLDEINKFANRLAAFVCTQKGATPKVPDTLAAQI